MMVRYVCTLGIRGIYSYGMYSYFRNLLRALILFNTCRKKVDRPEIGKLSERPN